jgi:hypothetical protein
MYKYKLRRAVAHCHPFFEQPTPFPHIPFVRCTFTIHVANLPANFHRMNFKNVITSRTSQVSGFSIFVFIFNVYSEWKKKSDTLLRNTRVPLDMQKTTDLHRKCARHLRYGKALSFRTFWPQALLCSHKQ